MAHRMHIRAGGFNSNRRNYAFDKPELDLQENRQDFYSTNHSPADRSLLLPGYPESASRTKTKNCARPSAYQSAGPTEHSKDFHWIT